MNGRYDTRDGIAVVCMDTPPVNSLGLANRRFIADAMERALGDAAVRAVVLTGAGRGFSGGADIREFGAPEAMAEPHLLNLIDLIEGADKPVVAAIHGVVMGGGLELAMGCHYRVVAPGTLVALPEVKLGLLPGGSGTQRLPRLLGVERALNMIVTGDPVKSEVLCAVPGQKLFDRLVEGDLLAAACAFAHDVAGVRPLPRVRAMQASHPNAAAYFQFARNTIRARAPQYPAPLRNVDCVEKAVTARYEDGLAEERAGFMALLDTPESKALRHAFFGERAAAHIADVPADTPRRPIERVAVVGAGAVAQDIATSLRNAGVQVTVFEAGPLAGEGVRGADLVVDAVPEDLAARESVIRLLDEMARPGAILASGTGTPDLNRLAASTRRPQDVVGLQFQGAGLIEVVRGAQTAPDVLATVMALARRLGRTAVVSYGGGASIGSRLSQAYARQAGRMLAEGTTPRQIDRAIERFGVARGPFRDAAPQPAVAKVPPRQLTDDEIVHRLVYALANEGARLLDEGVAARASDIDMVFLAGHGFPRWRGGPMCYADTRGIFEMMQTMRRFAANPHDDAAFWQPAPRLVRLLEQGKTLT
ncbi:MAG: enoyl-CoA hydratase-related protein [Pseudomonadota bacterium]